MTTVGSWWGRGFGARLLLVGAVLFGVVGAVLLGAVTWNALRDARDARRFRPPGTLVTVDGVRLHLYCTGRGGPTVVMDTGHAMPYFAWARVQPLVAARQRVCSYDRQGHGYSDADPQYRPRTTGDMADQLHRLLATAGETGPYVLVGHSNGGLTVRSFALRHPRDVAGMVLVDASSEHMDERWEGADWKRLVEARRLEGHGRTSWLRVLTAVGGLRWALARAAARKDFDLGPERVAEAMYLMNRPTWYASSLAELDGMMDSYAELGRAPAVPLGDVPLRVLTARNFRPNAAVSDARAQEMTRIWVEEIQTELVKLSTRGQQILVDSGHLIPLEAPEAVAQAVFAVSAR